MTKVEELTGEIIKIDSQNKLALNSNFEKFLNVIPEITKHAQEVLANTADEIDEKQIKATNQELKPIKNAQATINKAKTYIKNTFNENRDAMLKQFDQILADNGVDELIDMVNQVKQREKDIINQRKQSRWNELEELFKHELINYPDLKDLSFDWFKNRHANLVSGAATRKLKDTDRMQVTNDLNALNNDVMQFKLFKAQGVIDDDAAQELVTELKHDLMNEDGGLNTFNQLLMTAVQKTNQHQQAIQQKLMAEQQSKDAVDNEHVSDEQPVTEPASPIIDDVDPTSNIDNADLPEYDDVSNESPDFDNIPIEAYDEIPPYDEPDLPVEDRSFTISPNVALLIKEAGSEGSMFAGIVNDDPKIKRQQTLLLIKNITIAFTETDHHNTVLDYLRSRLNENEAFEMIMALANRIVEN